MSDLRTLALAYERVRRAEADEWARIAAEAGAERRDWTDQAASALGRRRHCTAVKRRVAAGDSGAAIVGRRHLLSADALAEEMAALSNKPRKAGTETGADRMLRIVGGAR